jgi:hypothetical protein
VPASERRSHRRAPLSPLQPPGRRPRLVDAQIGCVRHAKCFIRNNYLEAIAREENFEIEQSALVIVSSIIRNFVYYAILAVILGEETHPQCAYESQLKFTLAKVFLPAERQFRSGRHPANANFK